MLSATAVGEEIELGFSVNYTQGVDAFTAVSDDSLDLEGANMGPTVAPEARATRVVPTVQAGQAVYLAVRAYHEGTQEAESNIMQLVYQPTGSSGGEGEGENGPDGSGQGSGEPPPPEPLAAPTLNSVVRGAGDEVAATWTYAGCPNFHRFEVQRRTLELVWETVGMTMDPAARQWIGGAPNTTEATPFRVVVFNMAEESAASNEVTITPMQPLYGPTITSVQPATPEMARIIWDWPGGDFSRFVVQQRVSPTQYEERATITDPAVREWIGPYVPTPDPPVPTFRVVVWNSPNLPAASQEVGMSG